MNVIHKPDEALARILRPQKATPGTEYVPSRFALPFSCQEKSYLFNTLTKELVEAELPSSCRAGEGYDELIAGHFLVPRGKDECAFYLSTLALMRVYCRREGVKTYIILPTMACNARCVYCFEEGYVPVTMTPETEEQVLRYILDTREKDRKLSISWFGGEPLLGVRTIDRISQGLKDAGVEFTSYMVTNASLITPELVKKMTELWNLTNIQISMDGAEEDYRSRKKYCVYHDEYHLAIRAVNWLTEAGIHVAIRCNVDEENLPRVPLFLEDLKAGIADREHVAVYLTPLYETRCTEKDTELWDKVFAFESQISAAGFQVVRESQKRTFSFRLYSCMADRGFPAIGPDGGLFPCEHCQEERRIGDIWNGITEPDRHREFCLSEQVQEKCRECPLLPVCTPFSKCPVQDFHCVELRRRILMDSLRQCIESGGQFPPPPSEELSDC